MSEFLMSDRQYNCPICKYEIRAIDLDSVKTFSTIYKPNENKKKILQEKGFRLKSVNDNFYTYEKDGGTVITIVPKEKYGIKCRCSNGNDIWYEPITDEVDGWVERTSDGAIVKVTMDNRLVDQNGEYLLIKDNYD